MSYVIFGILFVGFVAFVIMSAKTWHWSNIVFLCLTFLAGMGYLVAAAQVFDGRSKAIKAAEDSAKQVVDLEQQVDFALVGDPFSHTFGPDSLRGLSEKRSLEEAGRGRVWKSGQIASAGNRRVYQFAEDRADFDEAQVNLSDVVLYAFADFFFEDDDNAYPALFVGSFRVASETAKTIELDPVFIANAAEYDTPSSSWTLFEKSPTDRHDAYLREFVAETNLDVDFQLPQPIDQLTDEQLNEYRDFLVSGYLSPETFGLDLNDAADAARHETIVDRIFFDGLPLKRIEQWIEAAQGNRIAQRFDPDPEEIFVKYVFEENSNADRPYQVDADGNIENDGQFNANGYAVDPSLHAGKNIQFAKGDEIIVDKFTADGFQRGDQVIPSFETLEPVTPVYRLYVRRLNDYPLLLTKYKLQTERFEKELVRIREENRRTELAITEAQNQEAARDLEIENLLADQARFESDFMTVNQFLESTKLRKADIDDSISKLDDEVRSNYRKLRASSNLLEKKMAEKESSKTEATSAPAASSGRLAN